MTKRIYESEFTNFVFEELDRYYEKTTVGNEFAYESDIGCEFKLRILSTVTEKEGYSRSRGNDSVKIHIYKDDKIVRSTSHVKRTKNYKRNIKDRIATLVGCPNCHSTKRYINEGKYGYFFSCQSCEETESFEYED